MFNFGNFEILNFKFENFEILIFRFFEKIFLKNFQIKIFKILFLHDNKICFVQNFFDDLEFSYTFDLAYFQRPRRCTEISRRTTLTGRTSSEKSIFDEFSKIFDAFWLAPQQFASKNPTEPIFKKLKLEEKNPKNFQFVF